jgi:hypothetical protein
MEEWRFTPKLCGQLTVDSCHINVIHWIDASVDPDGGLDGVIRGRDLYPNWKSNFGRSAQEEICSIIIIIIITNLTFYLLFYLLMYLLCYYPYYYLGVPLLPTWWVKISTYLQLEPFL